MEIINLIEAKRNLYSILLQMKSVDMTDNEVDIGYLLAKDKDMQNLFERLK